MSTTAYPSNFTASYGYNQWDYQSELTDAATGAMLGTADTRGAEGHLTQRTYGNDVATAPRSSIPTKAASPTSWPSYPGTCRTSPNQYVLLGNIAQRTPFPGFTYDALNRLTSATIGVDIAKSFSYDPMGNLISKSDVGNYSYPAPGQPFPHAVTSISGSIINTTFSYDANGNMTSGNGLAISYTAFNKPETVTRGSNQIVLAHDSEHNRIKQIGMAGETLYLNVGGVLSEQLIGSGGTTQWTDYLFAGGEMIGMRVEHSASGTYTRWFHKDHLGSISAITDETGVVVERLSVACPRVSEAEPGEHAHRTVRQPRPDDREPLFDAGLEPLCLCRQLAAQLRRSFRLLLPGVLLAETLQGAR